MSTAKKPSNIGRLLRVYRTIHDIDMRTLAADIGISSATVCRLENGYGPDAEVMVKLITWLFRRA